MLDREFVTRFIAFYINDPASYTPDLDSFLNNSMRQLSSLTEEQRNQIKNNFIASMKMAYEIFDEWAFRKADQYPDRRKPINKALFDTWSVNLAKLTGDEQNVILKNKEKVWDAFVTLIKKYDFFWDAITSSTGDKQRIIYRFQAIENLLKGIIS